MRNHSLLLYLTILLFDSCDLKFASPNPTILVFGYIGLPLHNIHFLFLQLISFLKFKILIFFFDIASSKNVLNRSHPTFLCFTILKIKITDAIIHHHTKTGSILTAITRRLFFFDHAFSPTSNSILIMNCQIIYGI